ncbi:MAG TPA: hypothetical protein VFK85_10765 [Anaeromyxobacteraceae bacterium]|nr:hypothetical protein [Anaeromyxobacteraceae bacterium]
MVALGGAQLADHAERVVLGSDEDAARHAVDSELPVGDLLEDDLVSVLSTSRLEFTVTARRWTC